MDAITLLRDDHQTVEQLFKRFEQAGDNAFVTKRQIVDRIIEELSVHAVIEEQLFYPTARASVPETEGIALESLEEHHVVKWLLSELADMDPRHERFDAKVMVLIENVRHHVEEEEGEFFPKVRDAMGRNELSELGDHMVEAKKTAATRPHPRLPDSGPVAGVAGLVIGVVDRIRDNIWGVAQGSVNAVGDLVARITGSDTPKVSPTGSSVTRRRADEVRRTAATATDGVEDTVGSVVSGASSTAKAASAGAKGTVTTAKRTARETRTTAKRGATTTGRTAKGAAEKTVRTATRAASKTADAASGAR